MSTVEALIREHIPLADHIVWGMLGKIPSHIRQDDLRCAALEALVKAAHKYDESRGISFEVYASFQIKFAVINEIRAWYWKTKWYREKEDAGLERTLTGLNDAVYQVPDAAPGPDDVVVQRDQAKREHDALATALATLPDRLATVVRERYLNGRKTQDIASDLSVSRGRVSQLCTKALRLLREDLSDLNALERAA